MSIVMIMGAPASGKTYAIKTLPVEQTVIISCNPMNKGLPFKGGNKSYSAENKNFFKALTSLEALAKVKALKTALEKGLKKKYLVIDDSQYLMFNEFMKRSKEAGFQKFTDIQKGFYDLLLEIAELPMITFLLHHTEEIILEGVKDIKIKTLGKLLDEKVSLEGLFDEILFAKCISENEKASYVFITQSAGIARARSREGMFEELYIPNDLLAVANAIEEYEG